MSSMDRIRRETIEQYGDAPANAIEALDHVLAVFADQPDLTLVVKATDGIYGDGVRTGLLMRDLRDLRTALTEAFTCPTCGAPNATRDALNFHGDAAH
jgi:hypothetical protein